MIEEFFAILKKDYTQFGTTAKALLKDYGRLVDIFHAITQWIPLEFFILLVFSVLLVLVFNNVSSKTRKINYIFSLLLAAAAIILLNKHTIGRFKAIAIGKAALYIIIPTYIYYLFTSISSFLLRALRKRKLGKPGQIERSIFNLQMAYNESMAQAHLLLSDGEYDTNQLKEKLNYLKIASDGLIASLEKQKN